MSKQLFDRLLIALFDDLGEKLPPEFAILRDLGEVSPEMQHLCISNYPTKPYVENLTTFDSLSLIKGVVKKFVGKSRFSSIYTDEDRKRKAFDTFLESNALCSSLNSQLASESLLSNTLKNHILSEASWLLTDWFSRSGVEDVPLSEIFDGLRPGPGASIGAPETDFYTKMANSPLTYSSEGLRRLYKHGLQDLPLLAECEQHRQEKHGCKDSVTLSKTTTVRKSVETDRTVCTEPSLNMLFQLSTGRVFERVLRVVGINLSTQPDWNRLAARFGSELYDIDSSFCTIDLKSASDGIYIELVKRLFIHMPQWFNWLMFIRTGTTLIEGEEVQLHMISTMGNGFTFPLQTLIFAAITEVTYNLMGWEPRKRRPRKLDRKTTIGSFSASPVSSLRDLQAAGLQYGVFGDDIICKRGIFPLLVNALSLLGFRVNTDKSFSEGPFRESCGQDWLHGIPVRPVYVIELKTIQDRFSLINRLIRWSTRTGIKLPRSVGLLFETIPMIRRNLVPAWESDDAGIQVPYHVASKAVSVLELQTPTLRKKLSANVGSLVYKRDTPIKRTISFWDMRFSAKYGDEGEHPNFYKDSVDSHPINWGGVLLAITGGYINGAGIVRRTRVTRYKESTFGCSSSWDGYWDVSRYHGWLGSTLDWKSMCGWYCDFIFCIR